MDKQNINTNDTFRQASQPDWGFRCVAGGLVLVFLGMMGVWLYRQNNQPATTAEPLPTLRTDELQPKTKPMNPQPSDNTSVNTTVSSSGEAGILASDQTVSTDTSPTTVRQDISSQPRDVQYYYRRTLPALRNPTLLVEKSRNRLSVFDQDKLVKIYPCITGANIGDKEKEGDKKTPEGRFYVCVKNRNSKYVRSLGLSYPSTDDAARGLQAGLISRNQYNHITQAIAAKRQPLWNTKLGGEIMIHGCRCYKDSWTGKMKPRAGTLGCIAIDNKNILELFPRIPRGATVIVRP